MIRCRKIKDLSKVQNDTVITKVVEIVVAVILLQDLIYIDLIIVLKNEYNI